MWASAPDPLCFTPFLCGCAAVSPTDQTCRDVLSAAAQKTRCFQDYASASAKCSSVLCKCIGWSQYCFGYLHFLDIN